MKRTWLAIAVALAALVVVPSAYAHAILQKSAPSNNSVARTSPSTVSLQFNEAVETAFGSIRVYDCGGGRVDSGKIVRPSKSSVAVKIDRKLGQGTYTVTWRVISADSHPVAGAFVFNVKKASASGTCEQVFNAKTPARSTALFKFARALDFALILLVVGGAVALDGRPSLGGSELRARLYRILAGLAFGLVFAGALCIVLQGAVAGGFGLSEAFRWDTVHSVLQTRFGKSIPLADRDRGRRGRTGASREPLAAAGAASAGRLAVAADGVRGRPCAGRADRSRSSRTSCTSPPRPAGWEGSPSPCSHSCLRERTAGRLHPVRSPVLDARRGLRRRTDHGREPSRLRGGEGVPRPLGHDLRTAPAGEDRARAPAARTRRLQQPLRRAESERPDRIGDRAAPFPASGRRGARDHGRDHRRHRGARHRAAGEGVDPGVGQVRDRHCPDSARSK